MKMHHHQLASRALTALAILALGAGCGSPASGGVPPGPPGSDGGIPSSHEGTGGSSSTATLDPFTRPFTALVSQPVPFSVVIATVESASVNRGQSPDMPPDRTYAQLDFSVQNTSASDLDYSTRRTWDLVLSDGTRVPPSNPLGIFVAGSYTAKASLRYPVEASASLAGAAVILDGEVRGLAEPERVPLDAPWSSAYPIGIPSLAGATSTGVDQELDITKATVSLNDPDEYRAHLGKKFVRLDLVAKDLGPSSMDLSGDSFRIIVDGLSSPPANDLFEFFQGQTAVDVPVVFEIDQAATSFDIRFSWYHLAKTYHVDL